MIHKRLGEHNWSPRRTETRRVALISAAWSGSHLSTGSQVTLGVEARPALFHQETVAARTMGEQVQELGLRPETLGADKAYGSGEFFGGTAFMETNRKLTRSY